MHVAEALIHNEKQIVENKKRKKQKTWKQT